MATWPNTAISTANVDAGNDLPRLARSQIKDTIDAVNNIINVGPSGESVVVAMSGVVTRPDTHIPGNFSWRPHMTEVYATGNSFVQFRANVRSNVAITSGPYFVLPPGRYEFRKIIQSTARFLSNGNFWFNETTTSRSLEANPGSFTVNSIEYVVPVPRTIDGYDSMESWWDGRAGIDYSPHVPDQIVVTANVTTAQANGGGWGGSALGTSEGVGIQGNPGFQYFQIRKIA